ncbi:hypothetical protein AWU82_29865 [Pseudomonas glycinae]|uniref:Phage protein n=1 Tax=Pseudomonas glycinae TaxID=1785145 RepID=A0ABM6QI28_9PSED|nr:hypothetical protein AWU82_29865 [Pseudomonas glycinae]
MIIKLERQEQPYTFKVTCVKFPKGCEYGAAVYYVSETKIRPAPAIDATTIAPLFNMQDGARMHHLAGLHEITKFRNDFIGKGVRC